MLQLIADCAAGRLARRHGAVRLSGLQQALGSWLVGHPLIQPCGMMTNKRIAAAASLGFHAPPTWPLSCLTPLSKLFVLELSDTVILYVAQGRVATACSLCSKKCKQGDVSDDEGSSQRGDWTSVDQQRNHPLEASTVAWRYAELSDGTLNGS